MATNYQVKKGDCLYCVAQEQNLLAETIWNHPNNAQLKAKRKQLNQLAPGDVVFFPDIQPKEVSEPTNLVHKFQTKWGKHKHWLEIELVGDDDKPVASAKYKVTLPDGAEQEGTLDQNGWARIEAVAKGTCKVTFPELDEKSWKFIETVGPKTTAT